MGNKVEYQIVLSGLKATKGTIPVSILKNITDVILDTSEKVLRLFVEGTSSKRGKPPEWIIKSLDFTLTGIGEGSTVIKLSVPQLGDSMPEYFQQADLWGKKIEPDETAISLITKSMSDVFKGDMESDYYDSGILASLQPLGLILKKQISSIEIKSNKRIKDFIVINQEYVKKIKEIKLIIPESRVTVISGLFNMIEHSQGKFQLTFAEGKTLAGELDPTHIDREDMRKFWGKKVTIKGTAHFQPSGKIHFIKAQVVKDFETGDEILEKIPRVQRSFKFAEDYLKEKNANLNLSKIWGKWPGDESIDELLEALDNPI